MIWPDIDIHKTVKAIYPVVSVRGKLATVKVNFDQVEDYVYRNPVKSLGSEHPALSVTLD